MAAEPDRLARLKEEFISSRGHWSSLWGEMLQLDADFFESYLRLAAVPWRIGTLSSKTKELICIAANASTTHLYGPSIRIHMRNALKCGATQDEIMEVMELAAVLGIHSATSGVPILIEELEAAGRGGELASLELGPREHELKERFTANRGYWSDVWNHVLRLSPDFFEAYLEFSSVPWRSGCLEPKTKELIYIAIDVSTTHLYDSGTRIHIRNALGYGATAKEIMEVFELVSVLGIHTLTEGVPILVEEVANVRDGQ